MARYLHATNLTWNRVTARSWSKGELKLCVCWKQKRKNGGMRVGRTYPVPDISQLYTSSRFPRSDTPSSISLLSLKSFCPACIVRKNVIHEALGIVSDGFSRIFFSRWKKLLSQQFRVNFNLIRRRIEWLIFRDYRYLFLRERIFESCEIKLISQRKIIFLRE